ncbi:helix-turn-helix domain-containing protein [Chitinophaga pinensis]|uniref:Helix-turn-helix domain-containing protein n=1 Tax=Chitinophaga pinensis TaxID=79329 RepID=A0A5C6LXT1_9BACT|nr:AraC family transcriptional regulator [Chitinophaga pinensis]TWW01602.1 helix-turn-helix domain-containing protein [Chitinophaga pinensis]
MLTETLEDFYQNKIKEVPANLSKETGHFNVFSLENHMGTTPPRYSRKTFYKIGLSRGHGFYHYADKSIEVSGTTLMFFNPNVPYTWQSLAPDLSGFFCIFREGFFTERIRGSITDFPMFAQGGKPAYFLNDIQDQQVTAIFEKIMEEIQSDYIYKYDLLNNYVMEIIHYALKLSPSEKLYQHSDAKTRITSVFTELLERQFPIESPHQRFELRSANDFARHLSVHVNHLNRAIKETTGRTTTEHIFERLASEAKSLLKHTDWNISEISYALGFEEPAHFNKFFRRQVDTTPTAYRNI